MVQALAVIQVLLCMALVGLILMHSGRDSGLAGMGFTPQSQGGTHIVERNLTRLTIVVAILFFANTVLLFRLLQYPHILAPDGASPRHRGLWGGPADARVLPRR